MSYTFLHITQKTVSEILFQALYTLLQIFHLLKTIWELKNIFVCILSYFSSKLYSGCHGPISMNDKF